MLSFSAFAVQEGSREGGWNGCQDLVFYMHRDDPMHMKKHIVPVAPASF